ncbi:MAG: ABC-F family ATP-binding cassette domain-containing protein [Acidimicrobiia bacterium]
MAVAISVTDLEFGYPGAETLFFEVSFKVAEGERAALIGDNAVGKSTLLRILAGQLQAEEGTVQIDGTVLHMPQSIGQQDDPITVREFMAALSSPRIRIAAETLWSAERANQTDATTASGMELAAAISEWEGAGGFEVESHWDACTTVVLRQHLSDAALRPVRELSGGERKRLALEFLLSSDVEALVLDEPDNFLDIPAKRWLERQLIGSRKTILMISHDRELLTRAVDKVVTLEGSGAWVHGASFATYHEARDARNRRLGDALQRWKHEERRLYWHFKIMKQRASVNDGNAPRAKAAETRWEKFVAAGPPPAPPPDQRVSMNLSGGDSGRVVLRSTHLELSGLTDPFSVEVRYGDRLVVLGANGSGKTHFLKLLAGDNVAHEGELRTGARVEPGAFSQTNDRGDLHGRTPSEVLSDHLSGREAIMRSLARYGLADVWDLDFAQLSGGQQARLQILTLEAQGANLLLLDEPTDNLDLISAEALEEALLGFRGTVVAVTHDRWFMRSFGRFLIFGLDGSVTEALDLSSALSVIGDAPTEARAHLVPLSSSRSQ